MKHTALFIISFLLVACGGKPSQNIAIGENRSSIVKEAGETIRERVPAPKGYTWVDEVSGSFGSFLQNVKVKKVGSPILDYKGNKIGDQSNHIAILDYDIGKKDLQQCADAVIRLHAEYLYHSKQFDKIQYHFTNGDLFKWDDYKKGIRPQLLNSNTIAFKETETQNDSYESFRNYLDVIFTYAGSISLNKETRAVKKNSDIKTGDILVKPGSPGHAMIIVGHAKNGQGNSIYLLAEGYTPAQSIHIVNNPTNRQISPWYELDISKPTETARYPFPETNIRSFNE